MKKFRVVLLYLLLASLILGVVAFFLAPIVLVQLMDHEVSIHGQVTRDGKPLVWEGDQPQLMIVTFLPIDRSKTFHRYPATCDTATGTFSIAKIPTGTYTVAIQQLAGPMRDLLNFGYDPAHSNLERTVTHDGQEFHFDLPKDIQPGARPGMPKGRPEPK